MTENVYCLLCTVLAFSKTSERISRRCGIALTPQQRQQLAYDGGRSKLDAGAFVAKSCRDSSERRRRRLDLFNQTTVVVTRWRHLRRRPPVVAPAETIPAFVTVRLRPVAASGSPPALQCSALSAACPLDRVYCYRPDPGRLAAAGVGSGRDQCELSADMFRAFPSTHNSCRRRRLALFPSTLHCIYDDCIEELYRYAASCGCSCCPEHRFVASTSLSVKQRIL